MVIEKQKSKYNCRNRHIYKWKM